MLQSRSRLKLFALTLSLIGLTLFWANIAGSAAQAAEIEYTGSGYYLSKQAGSDILAGWSSDRVAKETYKAALDDVHLEWRQFKNSMESEIAEIRKEHRREREEWRKELRRSRSPGFGIFLGAGYSSAGGMQAVIGIGAVWKIF